MALFKTPLSFSPVCGQGEPSYVAVSSNSNTSKTPANTSSREATFVRVDNALQEWRDKLGPKHPDIGVALKVAGDACYNNEDYSHAVNYYNEALNIVLESITDKTGAAPSTQIGKQISKVADLYMAAGLALHKENSDEEAINHFEEAMKLYRGLLVQGGRDACEDSCILALKEIDTWNHIGNIHFQHSKYDLAMKKYQYALKDALILSSHITNIQKNASKGSSYEKSWTSNAEKTLRTYMANTFTNIANVHGAKKDSQESMKRYNQALQIQVEVLGDYDPSITITLHNIGTTYYQGGHYELALKAYKQVLKIRRAIFGNCHRSVVDAYIDIVNVLDRLGQSQKSINVGAEALRLAKQASCDQQDQIARIHHDLGVLKAKSGKDQEAYGHFQDAYGIYKLNDMSDEHPTMQALFRNMADIRYGREDDNKAWDSAVNEIKRMFDFTDSYNPFTKLMDAFTLEDEWVDTVLGHKDEERMSIAVS